MQLIGKNQLAIVIMLFLIGSTPLFELGMHAKQDAWLALTLAASVGLLMTAMYLRIYKRAPAAGLGELQVMHFGLWAGKAISLLYVLWFSYEAMRNLRTVGELTSTALLTATPAPVILLLFLGASAYTVHKGIEVFVRVAQLLMPIVALSYGFIVLLLFIAKLPDLELIQPVLEYGIAPVAQAAFPELLVFPFGQLVVMLVFWKHVGDKRKLGGVSVRAQLVVSLFLILMNVLIMSVLGPELSALTTLPLLEVIQLVKLANFLERLDVWVTLLLFIGLYIKLTTLYFAAVLTLSFVCGVHTQNLIAPLGVIIFVLVFAAPSTSYFLWLGQDITLQAAPIFQIGIPVLMLLVGIRKKYRKPAAVDAVPPS